ncbi:hypothetical protein APC61_05970 [Acinetobacter baumannii]|uniref:hypothetical protein n=1 Tax=Acinetobacter baumannii TaxID=470 RepID=UPI00070B4F74|nr:hypothetical protein [Acinetobacter baumannii]KRI65814.1 hypothetical protein APC61_05970 [Acinetobacter baumannii]
MNAIKFIQDNGVDKAREVVEGAPDGHKGYNGVINQYTRGVWFSRDVMLSDLKRLVESVDLVNSLGGIKAARSEAHKDCFVYNQPLLAAIAAYESIYGGGDE